MRANDIRSDEPLRHGAYLCFAGANEVVAGAAVPELVARFRLRNEFVSGDDGDDTVAYLRRVSATTADIADDALLGAGVVIHVSSLEEGPVAEFCEALLRVAGGARVLAGVVRPMVYTGNAMYNFAYAHRVLQQPGGVMPNAFLVPTSKTEGWWKKDWMERHTYFLPRYDDSGQMRSVGHPLAAAAGIECLMRRTYKSTTMPAPAGEYDFLNYFECGDDGVAAFHEVCAALRDTAKNPEWRFVREGPTWHGRRVATWKELFA